MLRVSIIRRMFDRVGVDVYYVTAKYVEGVEVMVAVHVEGTTAMGRSWGSVRVNMW